MASYYGHTGVRLPWREDCILVSSRGHNNNSVVSSVSLYSCLSLEDDEGLWLVSGRCVWRLIGGNGVKGLFYSCSTLKSKNYFSHQHLNLDAESEDTKSWNKTIDKGKKCSNSQFFSTWSFWIRTCSVKLLSWNKMKYFNDELRVLVSGLMLSLKGNWMFRLGWPANINNCYLLRISRT